MYRVVNWGILCGMGYHPPDPPIHCRMAVFRPEFLRGKRSVIVQVNESAVSVPVSPDDTPAEFANRFIRLWEEYPREPELMQQGAAVFVVGNLVKHIQIKGK